MSSATWSLQDAKNGFSAVVSAALKGVPQTVTRHGRPAVVVVAVVDVECGVVRQRARNPAFAEALASWLEATLGVFRDRVLRADVPVARRWGQLSGRFGHDGADRLIAATALVHDLTVATRNVRHFASTGARVEDPFVEQA